MADISNEDLKNLILSKFTELDKKIDVGFAELRGEITELRGEIKALDIKFTLEIRNLDQKFTAAIEAIDQKFTAAIEALDQKFTAEIKNLDQKFTGEIKNLETKIDGFNSRLGFQEFVSRSLLVGLLVTFSAGVIKFTFFSDLSIG